MRSPFPGMDPYIEARGLWGDFHNHLVCCIKEALAKVAPERYLVRIGIRSYEHLVVDAAKSDYPLPGVKIVDSGFGKKELDAGAQPWTLRAFQLEEHREGFVEIYDTEPEQHLVTIIEVLSPSNKRIDTPGWNLYRDKRRERMLGGIHLIEIDLLRGGQRMPMLDPWPNSPYTLLVARAKKPHACKVWPAHYQKPLPAIPVPLTKPDPDVSLDLQPLIGAIYQRSRYARSIDYTKPLSPPLAAKEVSWLKEQLRRVREGT